MNPDRLAAFSEEYVMAVLQAVVELNPHRAVGESPQEYALDVALTMLESIQARGVKAVENYVINKSGQAFSRVAAALGIDPTTEALQRYLDSV